jgi:hypothetical protein
MPCTEVLSKKYQTRKSPPFHAGDCKGATKKGKDGDYVSKPDARGIYKWVKDAGLLNRRKTRKAPKGTKTYDIHDNGNRPFRVEVSGKTVSIYKGVLPEGENDYDKMVYTKLVKTLTVNAVHIGESTCDSAAYIQDACGKWATGNTILLHVSGNKYIFVGPEIYEFTMEDEFEAFYSQIGHNDVPYPIVLGSKYVYLMMDGDHKYIPRELFTAKMNKTEWADAYSYYYGFKDLETGMVVNCLEQYRTNLKKRKQCQAQHDQKHRKRIKGTDTPMKGFKMLHKRL